MDLFLKKSDVDIKVKSMKKNESTQAEEPALGLLAPGTWVCSCNWRSASHTGNAPARRFLSEEPNSVVVSNGPSHFHFLQ